MGNAPFQRGVAGEKPPEQRAAHRDQRYTLARQSFALSHTSPLMFNTENAYIAKPNGAMVVC